ncbi:aspartyl/asparaginyl beta-hydroxylase domain-containing protein [Janibacter anophelis]|uniref:aspartyl/asparaginyl beta-hydroxylase domain-containing protein n=1 Tax=Janibacter anophelis TaxID=319054 RepID=UPI003F7E9260
MSEDFSGAVDAVTLWARSQDVEMEAIERVISGLSSSAVGALDGFAEGQKPTYGIPGLRSKPFWSGDEMPWWDDVRQKVARIWREYSERASATSRRAGGDLRRQTNSLWAKGNWSTVQLVHRSVRQPATAKFPETMQALGLSPGGDSCGMSFFSTLRAGTAIRPHTGYTNAHLRCHLVLKEAPEARFRVGRQWVPWREGDLIVFDDTFEHEAVADPNRDRVVLLFDVWHPDLTPIEQKAYQASADHLRKVNARNTFVENFASS